MMVALLVTEDSLLEIPRICQQAASSLLVAARPIPSELPTTIACDCTNSAPLFLLVSKINHSQGYEIGYIKKTKNSGLL
jgi:hypothetical protein